MKADGTGLECCVLLPFLVVWLPLMVSFLKFYWLDAPRALERWAEAEGCRIIRSEVRTWFRGPFSWTAHGIRLVYRVEVLDRAGRSRTAWIRTGGTWWYSAESLDVRWDDARFSPDAGVPGVSRGSPGMWDRELDA